jgi:hypothetical protein
VTPAFLESLQNLTIARAVAETWFPWVESIHVIAMATVAGTIFIVDSRLIGFGFRKLKFTHVSDRMLPWTWFAFAIAVITGTLMFLGNAGIYYENFPFRMKMLLMVLAGLNMLVFQFVTYRGISAWDASRAPTGARAAGVLSMTFWLAILGFGRWIGFTL